MLGRVFRGWLNGVNRSVEVKVGLTFAATWWDGKLPSGRSCIATHPVAMEQIQAGLSSFTVVDLEMLAWGSVSL